MAAESKTKSDSRVKRVETRATVNAKVKLSFRLRSFCIIIVISQDNLDDILAELYSRLFSSLCFPYHVSNYTIKLF